MTFAVWEKGKTMTDYIKREDTIKTIESETYRHDYLDHVIDIIEAIPPADVAPVRHGKYIGTEFDGYADGCPVYYEWKCSECGCVFEEEEPTYNYCPNCGARMDEEVKE